MKLQCILISLVLVKVMAITTTDYKISVYITNLQFEWAFNTKKNQLQTVVKDLVLGNKPIGNISMMLAVPELATTSTLRECVVDDQIDLQTEITRVTYIPAPQVDPNHECRYDVMADLGKDRRKITRQVIKSLIHAAINEDESAFDDFASMCRLIGLLRNTVFSKSFTTTAEVDGFGTCIIKDSKNGISQYRVFDGEIWEVEVDRVDELTQLLSEQVSCW